MDENVQAAAATETQQPAQDASPDIKSLTEQLESIKRAQAGSDRAYQESVRKAKELEVELENLRKEKMTEKERSEYELKQREAALEAKDREVRQATLNLSKMRLMGEKGLPVDYAEYINGNSDEEIGKAIDAFSAKIDKLVAEKVKQTLAGGEKPKAAAAIAAAPDLAKMSLFEIEQRARNGEL